MSKKIHVVLYGSLRDIKADSPSPSEIMLSIAEKIPLGAVIRQLNLPGDRIQLAMLNHRAVAAEALVEPGDRLALFPVEYPLFSDWNDFRFSEGVSGEV